MPWNTSVPASSDSPSGSCWQFQENWDALQLWGETAHEGPASANAGEHLLSRDKIFTFTVRGILAVGTTVTTTFIVPYSCKITKAYAYTRTAPTGATLILDIHKNNVTIWTNQAQRLSIVATQNDGSQTSFGVTSLVEGDLLDLDIDQVGATIAGSDLTVQVKVGQV